MTHSCALVRTTLLSLSGRHIMQLDVSSPVSKIPSRSPIRSRDQVFPRHVSSMPGLGVVPEGKSSPKQATRRPQGRFQKGKHTLPSVSDQHEWCADIARFTGVCTNYVATPAVVGAIAGIHFGPAGVLLGALTGGGAAHWILYEPIEKLSAGIGRVTGKVWQAGLHRATIQVLSKRTIKDTR